MKPSIFEIVRSIRRLPPIRKKERLREYISAEPRRSIVRRELENELQRIVTRQIEREDRQDRKARHLAS